MEKKEKHLIHKITHFAFQLTRKTPTLSEKNNSIPHNSTYNKVVGLESQLSDILFSIKGYLFISDNQEEINKYLTLLCTLYKLIAYTRDIYDGKGERDLTYMMITVWYNLFPQFARFMFEQLAVNHFSSWKDAKYLCHYVKYRTQILSEEQKETFIQDIVQIMNQQLYRDFVTDSNVTISWIAKWIPREKSKFSWLYECLVKNWKENYEILHKNPYKNYRKILTSLNQILDTPQIKQCERRPEEIDYYKVSLVTKYKNSRYFLQHPSKTTNPTTTTKHSKNIHYDVGELCQDTINDKTIQIWDKIRENLLEKQTDIFFLPILDMTTNDPNTQTNGIAISILLSEISQNRMMAYDQTNSFWISLENQYTLSDKILEIEKYTLNPHYYTENNLQNNLQTHKSKHHYIKSIECIIKSIIETKLPVDKMERMYLIFISDFANREIEHYSLIQSVFYSHGIIHLPHIVYWNISNNPTVPLPCSATTPNVTFLAGTSSINIQHLLQFSNKTTNPYTFLKHIVDQEKYNLFENYIRDLGNIE